MTREAQTLTPEMVLEQVELVLGSPDFDASERNARFLVYAVNETLAGRSDRIKAYTIATSVFGRGDNFDPQQDAIVRIEAGRLRRSLERYYLTSGQNDPVRIAIPTGSYVPVFTVQEPLDKQGTPKAAPSGGATEQDIPSPIGSCCGLRGRGRPLRVSQFHPRVYPRADLGIDAVH